MQIARALGATAQGRAAIAKLTEPTHHRRNRMRRYQGDYTRKTVAREPHKFLYMDQEEEARLSYSSHYVELPLGRHTYDIKEVESLNSGEVEILWTDGDSDILEFVHDAITEVDIIDTTTVLTSNLYIASGALLHSVGDYGNSELVELQPVVVTNDDGDTLVVNRPVYSGRYSSYDERHTEEALPPGYTVDEEATEALQGLTE